MARQVALLRGINVGPTTAVAMADLKVSFEALGLADVETYVRSGNVVFSGKATEAALEKRIAADFGRSYDVMLRTAADLRRIAKACPFPTEDGKRVHVMFLDTKPQAVELDPGRSPGDEFAVQGSEVFIYTPNGFGRSKLAPSWFEKGLGVRGTARNWNTVLKLVELTG
jgi:uncharacterized protein (DUF1697 family)